MLVASKNKNEKIVLGLLSYTFGESMTPSQQVDYLHKVRNNQQTDIFLYKENESENYIGVVVIEKHEASHQTGVLPITLESLALLPSYRNEGKGYEIFTELKELFPDAVIQGALSISELVKNWSVKYRLEAQNKE